MMRGRAGLVFCAALLLQVLTTSSEGPIRCSACQGTTGDPCDVTPWSTPHTVPCDGKCITRRTLYANGRNLRTIWRGCEHTIIPGILSQNFKNNCGYGNFFVECTRTCNGGMCNLNHTGIPKCWTCQGDYRSCDLAPPTKCDDLVMTTAPPAPPTLECLSCQGHTNGICDASSHLITDFVLCHEGCATRRTLFASNRSLLEVWRGCKSELLPGALNTCDESDGQHVNCTSTCTDTRCNKYATGFTDCWTVEGKRKSWCAEDDQSASGSDTFKANLIDETNSITQVENATANELILGTLLSCTSCQGVAGDPCDISPSEIPHTVSCRGNCITRRTLYANGRKLRSMWRGCDTTLFPGILDERFRNACQYGNFFVECTATCRTGDKCNQYNTGIPQCWSCLGDKRSCDIATEKRCEDPVEVTPTRPPRQLLCINCSSEEGGGCDVSPSTEPGTAICTTSCVTKKHLDFTNRTLVKVWRGCQDKLVQSHELNTCTVTHDGQYVCCAEACYDPRCNKYMTGFTDCWTTEGRLKGSCAATTRRPEKVLSPSRVSTKKPYSIQDALGGDNYRGEWRPSSKSPSDVETNGTTVWKRNYKWEGPYFSKNRNTAADQATSSLVMIIVPFISLVAYELDIYG